MKVNGREIDLFSLRFDIQVNGQRLHTLLADNPVISIKQTEDLMKPAKFECKLRLKSSADTRDSMFNPNSTLSLALGFQKYMVNKGFYFMDAPEFDFSANGPIIVTIKAVEEGYQGLRKAGIGRVFDDMSYSDVAALIAKKNKWIPEIQVVKTKKTVVRKPNESDMAMLIRIANKIGFTCQLTDVRYNALNEKGKKKAVDKKILHFHKDRFPTLKDPKTNEPVVLYYRMGPTISNVESLQFKIETWDRNQAVSAAQNNASRQKKKTEVSTEKQPKDIAYSELNKVDEAIQDRLASLYREKTVPEGKGHITSTDTDEETDLKQKAQLFMSMWNVECEGSMPLFPIMRAGTIVEIRGAGRFSKVARKCSGLYYITSVTHSIGSGGASTKFTAYTTTKPEVRAAKKLRKALKDNTKKNSVKSNLSLTGTSALREADSVNTVTFTKDGYYHQSAQQ